MTTGRINQVTTFFHFSSDGDKNPSPEKEGPPPDESKGVKGVTRGVG